MRINNPKTTAGGLPLATTWYVNSRHAEQKEYIDSISAFLSGYTDQEVAAAVQGSIERDEALSAMSDIRDSEVVSALVRYITGSGDEPQFVKDILSAFPADPEDPSIYYTPKKFGYAYLAENKKIDPSLMPDISVMDVTVTDIEDLFLYLKDNNYLAHDKELYGMVSANPTDLQTILTTVKRALELYILGNQTLDGDIKAFGTGDVLVITNFGKDNIAADLATDAFKMFTDVFSQSFTCGAWICNAETRKDGGLNATVSFVKASYNQGELVSVNGLVPTTDGNVTLRLPDLYKRDGSKIGEVLARNIEKIKSTDADSDTNAMKDLVLTGGLVDTIDVSGRFVFDDEIHGSCFAYTTINEFMNLNIATETARAGLSAAIDTEVARATAAEDYISGALDAEVERSTSYDEYLSSVVGDGAALSGVTVTSALVGLKQHADITAYNVKVLADSINTTDYDLLKVYTTVIPAGSVSDAQAVLGELAITAVNYANAHPGWDADGLAENNIYNYFGFAPAFAGADIAEIKFAGFKGKILDIYAEVDGKYEKIDADINYEEKEVEGKLTTTSSFTILGEYAAATEGPLATVIDKLVVRYTDKFTYTPTDVNILF